MLRLSMYTVYYTNFSSVSSKKNHDIEHFLLKQNTEQVESSGKCLSIPNNTSF